MIKKLKRIIKSRGVAYVAYALGFMDTPRVKAWVKRNSIPKKHHVDVLELIEKES